MSDQTVVFLHGVGAGPSSWAAQIAALPPGFTGYAPRVTGLGADDAGPFSLAAAASALHDDLDRRGAGPVHLCGLSLGAMVATRFAADHPDRTASLVLSGGQVRPPRLLMRVQSAVLRALPARVVASPGVSKRTLLAVLAAVREVDLGPALPRITAPTLVLCGARDRANLPAARALADGIPDARLDIVAGAGHEWNTQLPEAFSARLTAFLAEVSRRR